MKKQPVRHGLSKDPIYKALYAIKGRCKNPNYREYHNYGGRGISLCEEWDKSFISFYNWSMENGYERGLSIDRRDVNGNYEPANCRWVTTSVQNNNRRDTVYVEHKGKMVPRGELASKLGLSHDALRGRLNSGRNIDEIINFKPVRTKSKYFLDLGDKPISVRELSKHLNVGYTAMLRRHQRGLSSLDVMRCGAKRADRFIINPLFEKLVKL